MTPQADGSTDAASSASSAAASWDASSNSYRAPWWLRGAHLQTIVPALFAQRAPVRYSRERWDAPDGDVIEVDRLASSPSTSSTSSSTHDARPVLVVFHGLEGSAHSRYVRGLMAEALARGWDGVAPHFRGCGGSANLLPRFYHSGDSDEVDWVLKRVAATRTGNAPMYAVGISLGGNMLLKWLGERAASARELVAGAAAISAPMDLVASGEALGRGFNRIYARMFLRTLKSKSRAKLARFPALFDRARMEAARDLHAFDDVVTGPLHGFVDADDYWTRASSKPLLKNIAVPTLILNAKDDPFLPALALPTRDEVSSQVTLEFPDHGGHVGFVHAGREGRAWMPRRVMRFLAQHGESQRLGPSDESRHFDRARRRG